MNDRLPLDRIATRTESPSNSASPVAQERFSDAELDAIRAEFSRRLQEVFRGERATLHAV